LFNSVWSGKEEVNMAIIISSILKSPELLGIPKLIGRTFDPRARKEFFIKPYFRIIRRF